MMMINWLIDALGGSRVLYIGAVSILDPRIKLTLSNDVDLIFKAVENQCNEEGLAGGAHRLAIL